MTSTSGGVIPKWIERVFGSEMQKLKNQKAMPNVAVPGLYYWLEGILWIFHNVETRLSSSKTTGRIPKAFKLSKRLGLKKDLVALKHLLNKMGLFLWSNR